ncbi:hypothetical protein EUX98_g5907 [Antrodiella citrinella]|uniref:DUF7702 domain-containing protein n=1 Tax=Antrodiella citrinella TaxID=2447956 RepID=A0A4S4MY03_9APHY|nr:hypothetical protein EUX98_g5907 [Antrodiella citrinella]
MGLDARGGISAAQLVIYIPILVLSAILVKRHGFKRQAGWIFLLILSLVRIVGSAAHIAAELSSDPSTGLIETFSILDNVGLSPLIMCTIGFLNTIGAAAFVNNKRVTTSLRLLGLLATIAMILTIVGAINLGEAKTDSDVKSAENYRHIGGILYVVLFILVTLAHGFFWSNKSVIMPHRRTLLVGVSAVLPLLFVRTLYSILSDYSPVAIPGEPAPTGGLAKFSSTTGSWGVYLIMSPVCEILTVITYLVIGMTIPITQEYNAHAMGAVADDSRSDQALNSNYDQSYHPSYAKSYN